MQRRRQRRAIIVISDRIVIIPVDLLRFEIKLIIKDCQQHQHIRLLDNAVSLHCFHSQNGLIGTMASVVLVLIERRKLKKAIKLFEEPRLFVLWDKQMIEYVQPMLYMLLVQVELLLQLSAFGGRSYLQPFEYIHAHLDVSA